MHRVEELARKLIALDYEEVTPGDVKEKLIERDWWRYEKLAREFYQEKEDAENRLESEVIGDLRWQVNHKAELRFKDIVPEFFKVPIPKFGNKAPHNTYLYSTKDGLLELLDYLDTVPVKYRIEDGEWNDHFGCFMPKKVPL